MLLRSSSTPILDSSLNSYISQAEIVKEVDPEGHPSVSHRLCNPHQSPVSASLGNSVSHDIFTLDESPRRGRRDFEKDLVTRPQIRRVQSEGDLASFNNGRACKSAASSLMGSPTNESEPLTENTSSLHRQWTRRMSSHSRGSGIDRKDSIREESELLDFGLEDVSLDIESVECFDDGSEIIGGIMPTSTGGTGKLLSPVEPSVSGRNLEGFLMEDGEVYTSVSVGSNGLPLVCNSKGCRPMTESEKLGPMYMAAGLGFGMGGGFHGGNGSSGQGGGFGADSNSTEAYYQKALQADPQNPLLLRNYAQYLYEAKHDYKRAEEYFERAILACPSDGDVLSQYAKLVWDVHRDQDRAENYHDQAVQAAPDDCYVLASYASFLWESEDNEESSLPSPAMPPAVHGATHMPPSLVASA